MIILCEFWNDAAQECHVMRLFCDEIGGDPWPEGDCLLAIKREPTRENVCSCRLRALAQGRAFTYPAVAEMQGPWVQIVGQWPGDETDEESEAALAAMHGMGECPTCHGSGEVVVCVDDMCRAAGRCLHGDGERPCPDCQEQS